jgi:hypothetical protein
MTQGYFSAERAIVDRLAGTLPEIKSAAGSHAGALVDDASRRPCVAVIYDGYEPMGRGEGKSMIRQRWRITIVVDARNDKSGADARAAAGPIINKVISAVAGWKPLPELSPMELAAGNGAEYKNGVAAFSLVFSANLII